jgi:hypothetical protein
LLNVSGYFDPLLAMLDRAEKEGFVFPEHRQSLLCASEPGALLDAMNDHEPPMEAVKRWMRRG